MERFPGFKYSALLNKWGSPILIVLVLLILTSCTADKSARKAIGPNGFTIEFADPEWNGKKIPKGQQCQLYGGNGSTPRLIVSNIPHKANALVLEFNDKSYIPMDNGGHGIIGYEIPEGAKEVIVPSVPGHSFDLPDGFFIVQEHRGPIDKPGGYMPPCSGGHKFFYTCTVKAVLLGPNMDDKPDVVLAEAEIGLGLY